MLLDVTVQIMQLLIADAGFFFVCLLTLVPLSKLKPATFAVLKRNLFGYFNSPTGYVFICLFVLMGSAFAFWPHEFFNANLATLGELNKTFPLVMLLFIPTITMGIWAEERRQGTDELLLTIPATDWDIVLGKYLAVSSIFTFSLIFSQIANFTVLNILALGDIDTGLFATTYLGYWLIGLAMLALGMAGSFLTTNVTVAFILGVLINAPLVLAANADLIFRSADLANMVSRWSLSSQFDDLGRGVVSFKAIVFFAMIVVIGLYLSIVLIGRRHWYGGKDGVSLAGHFLLRTVSLVVVAFGVNLFFSNYDPFRLDSTTAKVSSLSPDTLKLIANLNPKHPIRIEAFISSSVPEAYTRTKVDLIAMLNEFAARGGKNLDVKIYDNLTTFSEDAARAEQQYGIEAEPVRSRDRGAEKRENIFLAAAFTSGLEQVIVPFFDHGIPVEYEIVRSINTVAEARRPRIGVVVTDAALFGVASQAIPRQLIIRELEKQYEVIPVDPNSAFEKFDVLFAVQPSSLTTPQLENLIDSIRAGQPTAIFEDPAPISFHTAPGTGQPKRPPKGDITRLLGMLGVNMVGELASEGLFAADVIYQDYNPYPKAKGYGITPEWVFASSASPGARDAMSPDDPITSGLNQLLLLFAGAIKHDKSKGMQFNPLVTTGTETGAVKFQDLVASGGDLVNLTRKPTSDRYILAARIRGKVKEDVAPAGSGATMLTPTASQPSGGEAEVNVVFVADIDLLSSQFIRERARPEGEVNWQFDNVPFVLNVLDVLAGDERLVEIRKRQTRHSTLRMIDVATESARDEFAKSSEEFRQKFSEARKNAQAEYTAKVEKIAKEIEEKKNEGQSAEVQRLQTELTMTTQIAQRRLQTQESQLQQERNRNIKRIERQLNQEVLSVQNWYKFLAVILPPIPPLVVGLVVFLRRRQRELEGVIDQRLR